MVDVPRRKLTVAQVSEIRALRSEGVPVVELASRYGVTRQHVHSLLASAPEAAPAGAPPGAVAVTVGRMIAAGRLDPADAALAAALARAIDEASVAGPAGWASLPRLARELRELVSVAARDEPDAIDQMVAERRRRLEGLGG